ncbi:MAG: hypothetical protein ACE5G9_03135 [Nitrospinales bacterium]
MHRVKAGFAGATAGTSGQNSYLRELEKKVYTSASAGSRKFKSHVDPVELLELGAAYGYQGEFKKSNEVLEEAYRIYNIQEERAIVSLSAISTQIGEASLSEGMGDYQFANYEKVFLHSLKAMNYLMQGDPAAARVEIERAYIRQKLIKERSGEELAKARASYDRAIQRVENAPRRRRNAVDLRDAFSPDTMIAEGQLPSRDRKMIQHLRSSYENAFTEVLSSVVYGLNGELGNSLPPLRRAVEISDNPFVRQDKIRLEAIENGQSRVARDNFYLFVFAGYAPEKQKQSIVLLNPWTGALNKVSYGKPVLHPSAVTRVDVLDADGNRIDSAPLLSRVSALALKDYDEKLPLIAMKTMSRLIVQSIKDYKLRENMGDLGSFLGSVMNLVVENADLRTWTLLPDKVFFYSGHIEKSGVTISIQRRGSVEIFRGEVARDPKKETVVFVRAWDNSARIFHKDF